MDVLVVHRDRQDGRIEALAAARRTRDDRKVALVFLALAIARSFLVAMRDRRRDALPFDEPVGLASIDRYVVDADLLARRAVEELLLHLLRYVLPGRIRIDAIVKQHRTHDLRIVIARLERCHGPFVERQARIRDDQVGVDLFPAADAQAIGACAIRSIEGEIARLQLIHGMPVLRAAEREREEVLPFRKAASRTG